MRILAAGPRHGGVPASVWVVRGGGALVVLALATRIGAALDGTASVSWSTGADVALAATAPMALLPAATSYLRHRAAPSSASAWMTLCLSMVASTGLLLADTTAAWHAEDLQTGATALATELVLTVLLLMSVAAAFAIVTTGAAARAALFGRGARRGLAVGLVSVGVAQVAAWRAPQDVLSAVLVVAAGMLGATLFAGAATTEAVDLLRARALRLAALQERVDELESLEEDKRARRHEVSNAVASIAMASSLLHNSPGLSPEDRFHLEEMLESEAARLGRLLAPAGASTTPVALRGNEPLSAEAARNEAAREVIDLDETLARIVSAEATSGNDVEWSACGLRAVGAADDVAEVVRILLGNARSRAPDGHARLLMRQAADRVEVVVADDAHRAPAAGSPGGVDVGPSVSSTVPGCLEESAGLALARRLLEAQGGSLLLDCTALGVTFVISLPAPAGLTGRPPTRAVALPAAVR